jgi:hypothetical protein
VVLNDAGPELDVPRLGGFVREVKTLEGGNDATPLALGSIGLRDSG